MTPTPQSSRDALSARLRQLLAQSSAILNEHAEVAMTLAGGNIPKAARILQKLIGEDLDYGRAVTAANAISEQLTAGLTLALDMLGDPKETLGIEKRRARIGRHKR
jgi:hypothetical protein